MITSRTNPVIVRYRKRKKELPSSSHEVVIEGMRLVEEALKSRTRFEALFFTPVMEQRASLILSELKHRTSNVHCVNENVMKVLSLEETPSGLLAFVEIPMRSPEDFKSPFLLLCGVQDPGNAGSLLRSAEGSGFSVLFSQDSVHPFHPKVVKASMGSVFRVPARREDLARFLDVLKQDGIELVGTRATDGVPYYDWNWKDSCAVLLGGEAYGIPKQLEVGVDNWISIPLHQPLESLNVAAAGAVILFEASRKMKRLLESERNAPTVKSGT